MAHTTFHVSKLDAAARQLRTAIALFINDSDPVSIHSLVCASHEILETLAKEHGIVSQKETVLKKVKPEHQKEVLNRLNAPRNFFKHASKDKALTQEFNPESNILLLWDSVGLYQSLTQEKIPLFVAFNLWMQASHPKLFILTPEHKIAQEILFKSTNYDNKVSFFQEMTSLAEESARKF